MAHDAPSDEALVRAGTHDRAPLLASLIPPGTRVALGPLVPDRLDTELAARGCRQETISRADVTIGFDKPVEGKQMVVACAQMRWGGESRSHGSSQAELDELATAGGRTILARQRYFEPPPEARDIHDPTAWVAWQAVLAGQSGEQTPVPQPKLIPGTTALLLADEPFNRWPEELRRATVDLARELREREARLVVSWSPKRLTGSLTAHMDLARAGVILHGGDGVFDVATSPPGLVAPNVASLFAAYSPRVAIVLDQAMLGDELAGASVRALDTSLLGLGFGGAPLEGGTTLPNLVSTVVDLVDRGPTRVAPQVATVTTRRRHLGLTSVVIPVHGQWHLTDACLTSLREHTADDLEIIVVDNASPDDTAERLSEQSDVQVVPCATNLGFAGGTNRGVQAATGEFVCLLNNDTEVLPGWLRELKNALGIAGTGASGPRSNQISGLQVVHGGPGMNDARVRDWGRAVAAAGQGRTWLTSRLVGFCMLFRGELLEEIGALDEAVGIGNFEDDELCQRVQKAGRTLRVADGAVVLHHGSATFQGGRIPFMESMRTAARAIGDRLAASSDLLVARIGAGTGLDELAASVRSIRPLADQIVVTHDGDELAVALHAVHVDPTAVQVCDATVRISTAAKWALHLPRPIQIPLTDWGRVRSELESLEPGTYRVEGVPGAVLTTVVGGHLDASPGDTRDTVTAVIPAPW